MKHFRKIIIAEIKMSNSGPELTYWFPCVAFGLRSNWSLVKGRAV